MTRDPAPPHPLVVNCAACYAPNSAVLPPALLWLLRLEGFAVAALSAALYAHTGASWWLFALLWLLPDVSMMAYLAGDRWGAYGYNALHSYLAPSALALLAVQLHRAWLLPYALIWFNHIGIDRLLGHGLKSTAGFGHTHLKHLGRRTQA